MYLFQEGILDIQPPTNTQQYVHSPSNGLVYDVCIRHHQQDNNYSKQTP